MVISLLSEEGGTWSLPKMAAELLFPGKGDFITFRGMHPLETVILPFPGMVLMAPTKKLTPPSFLISQNGRTGRAVGHHCWDEFPCWPNRWHLGEAPENGETLEAGISRSLPGYFAQLASRQEAE